MTARGRPVGRGRGSGSGPSAATIIAVLIAVAIAIAVAGLAAVVTVPVSLVVLVLVLAKPQGVGARIRGWGIWRHIRGLEPNRRLGTFAVLLALYGIVIPGSCLAAVVAVARSGAGGQGAGSSASAGLVAPTFTASPTPLDTVATPTAAVATAAPTAAPGPADACHVNDVTYCVLNPDVTQATMGQTICVSGWTASVRPPESYTESLKRQQIAAEGLPGSVSSYEEDHRMPLELGGAPTDVMNLSPESPRSPNPKDSDESRLKHAVCDGQMTLAQAQAQLVATWLAAYPQYKQ